MVDICSDVDDVGIHPHFRPELEEFAESRVDSSAFADRLNALFSAIHKDGAVLTNAGLVKALEAQDVACSKPYISQLRNGRKIRPSPALARAIAIAFGVPDDYFNVRIRRSDTSDVGIEDLAPDALLRMYLRNPLLQKLLRSAAALPATRQRLLSDLAAELAK